MFESLAGVIIAGVILIILSGYVWKKAMIDAAKEIEQQRKQDDKHSS